MTIRNMLDLEDPEEFALKARARNEANPDLPPRELNRQTGRTTNMMVQVYRAVQEGNVAQVRAHTVMFADMLRLQAEGDLKRLGIKAKVKRERQVIRITPDRETLEFVDHVARGEL